MSHPTFTGSTLTINLNAIASNYLFLCKQAPNATIAGVVKANAYGLGIEYIAPTLFRVGCRDFFVATVNEGLQLRALLPDVEIYILNGAPEGHEMLFQEQQLIPVLNSLKSVNSWSTFCRNIETVLPATLHIDTGMARLGFPPDELKKLTQNINQLSGFELRAIMSHLACASDAQHPMNQKQLQEFTGVLKKLPVSKASFASSSGIFLGPAYHFDILRPGAALYGICPLKCIPNPMAQVVKLQGEIIQIRDVDTPQTVGYGATYSIEGPRKIATVAVGYADGFLRSFSNRGFGYLDGVKVPVVGRVSMDLITLDITECPRKKAHTGAMVDLIGPHNTLDQVADAAGTIGYEILTSLGARYHRTYVGSP